MISPEKFLGLVGNKDSDKESLTRLATVATAGGTLTFDGESAPSVKEYPNLSSYVPVVGDRVVLLRVGHTWVILGKVV